MATDIQHHHRLNLLAFRWHQPQSTGRRKEGGIPKGFLLSDVSARRPTWLRHTICCPQLPAAILPTRPLQGASPGQVLREGRWRDDLPLYDVG